MHLPWLACTVCRSFLTIFQFLFPLWLALLRNWALLNSGLCFSSAHPFSCYHLLPYHSIIPAAKLFASTLLSFFGPAVYSSPNGSVQPLVLLLHNWRAPVSHLFSLGRPGPVCFPWASSAIFLTLHSPGLLLNSSGFPGPITLSLILGVHGLAINPLLSLLSLLWAYRGPFSLSISYIAHGLIFLFVRALLNPFTSLRPICLSHGPVIYYSCCLGLMGFLSICQLFFVHVARLLLPTWASKMAINRHFK